TNSPPIGFSKRVAQVESERNRHTGIARKEIAVRVMHDPDFRIDAPAMIHEHAHTHKILKREMPPRLAAVNDCSRNECGNSEGTVEIQIRRSRSQQSESKQRVQ